MHTTPPDVVTDLDLLVRDAEHVDEFLDGLAVIAARVSPPGFSVVVTVRRGGFLFTARDAPTGWDVRLGVDAIQEDEAIWTADLDTGTGTRGVGTSLSLPLHGGPDVVGSLTFYASEPRGFDAAVAETAAEFAEHASRALHRVVRRTRSRGARAGVSPDDRSVSEPESTSRPDGPHVDAPLVDAAEQDPDVDELSQEGHDEAAARDEHADGDLSRS